MANTLRRFSILILWWITVLIAAGGTILALTQDLSGDSPFYLLLYILPSLGLFLFIRTSRESFGWPRPIRVAHWLLTLVILLPIGQLAQAQWRLVNTSFAQAIPLLIAPTLLLGSSIYFWLGRKRQEAILSRGTLCSDLGWTAGCAILIAGTTLAGLNVHASNRELEAEQRWASIGRPMPEFANRMVPINENESLRQFERDLRSFGVLSAYKKVNPPADQLGGPTELSVMAIPGDAVVGSQIITTFLDESAPKLAALYSNLLTAEPPVWKMNPADAPAVDVPNLLALRKFAKVINADTLEKIRCGKHEEAREALTAGLRASQTLGKHPLCVSIMIRSGIEALFAGAYTKLQAEGVPDFDTLVGRDTEQTREAFRQCVQAEACLLRTSIVTVTDEKEASDLAMSQLFSLFSGFNNPTIEKIGAFIRAYSLFNSLLPSGPKGFSTKVGLTLPKSYSRPLLRLECAHASIVSSEIVRVSLDSRNLSESEFGMGQVDRLLDRYPTNLFTSFQRGWLRVNAGLLLREQAVLIRNLRRPVLEGVAPSHGEIPSRVLPSRMWQYSINVEQKSVATTLTTIPSPLLEVAPPEFFLIPIDGSKPWQFAPKTVQIETSQTTVAERSGEMPNR